MLLVFVCVLALHWGDMRDRGGVATAAYPGGAFFLGLDGQLFLWNEKGEWLRLRTPGVCFVLAG